MIDIISRRLWFFSFAALLIVVSIISLAVFGLKTGIDFSSGSVLTLKFEQNVSATDIKNALPDLGYSSGTVEVDAHGNMLVRTVEIDASAKQTLEDALTAKFGPNTELGFESVDPLVARQTARAGIIAVSVASVAILLYIAFAFRKVPKPFHYGVSSVVALILDSLVVLGVFSVLGRLANWEIDLALVTGVLTVIGYAINDTIVVFDRIRENQKKYPGTDFAVVVNNSLMQVMTREIITGLGVLFVLISLLLFVGPAIKNLAVVLMVGVYFGTFTSMFVAAPLLVVWEKRDWGTYFRKKAVQDKTTA